MNLPQQVYILFFNTTFKLTKHIDERIRDWIVRFSLFILVSLFFLQGASRAIGFQATDVIDRSIIGGLSLFILCIFAVKEPLQKVKWNKWLMYTYYFATVYMLISSLHHSPGRGYRMLVILMLVAFPALYFIWSNRKDYETYYNWLAKAIMISGSITIVVTYIFRPINSETIISGRYAGLTVDTGMLGLIGIIISVATFYLIAKGSKAIWFYMLITGIAVTFVWLSGTRTSAIVVFCQVVAWAIMFIRLAPREKKKKTVLIVSVTLCAIVISVPAVTASLKLAGEYITFTLPENTSQASTENPVTTTENPLDRFETEGKDLNQLSSGRLFLWKYYWERLNWIGNDSTDHKIVYPSGAVVHNAHNAYLEYAYRFGIPAGAAFLLFMVGILVMMFKTLFTGRKSTFTIFVVLALITYGIVSMLDAQTHPFTRGTVLLFYLALVGVFDNAIINKEESKEIQEGII